MVQHNKQEEKSVFKLPEWILQSLVGILIALAAYALKDRAEVTKWQATQDTRMETLLTCPDKIRNLELNMSVLTTDFASTQKYIEKIDISLNKINDKLDNLKP
jgi:hypothetical protein